MLLLLLDIHRNILSVQGFIRFTSDDITKIQISLKSNCIFIEYFKDIDLIRSLNVLMPNYFLQPCSVSSCCQNSKEHFQILENNILKMQFPLNPLNKKEPDCETRRLETTFRFQIDDNSVIDNCTLENDIQLHFKDFMQEKLEKHELFHIFCTSCNAVITDKIINIKSVHKYYEEITDSAETWFCHKHEGHESAEDTVNFLYISDMHFYLHDSMFKSLLILDDNKCFKCLNCLSTLSFKKKMNKPHYIGFFVDKIMFEKSETDLSNISKQHVQKYRRDISLLAFYSIIQDLVNFTELCNLYLQSKVDEKVEVLLLRFNSQRVVQFSLHQENDDELPNEVEFEIKEVYKVLFCICSPNTELSKKWKHDFNVEFFHVSDNMMAAIRELLQESSNYFPSNQETVDGFSFGYLPVSLPIV